MNRRRGKSSGEEGKRKEERKRWEDGKIIKRRRERKTREDTGGRKVGVK